MIFNVSSSHRYCCFISTVNQWAIHSCFCSRICLIYIVLLDVISSQLNWRMLFYILNDAMQSYRHNITPAPLSILIDVNIWLIIKLAIKVRVVQEVADDHIRVVVPDLVLIMLPVSMTLYMCSTERNGPMLLCFALSKAQISIKTLMSCPDISTFR